MPHVLILLLGFPTCCFADAVSRIVMPGGREISSAEMYAWLPKGRPRAAIVLCPGQNGSSKGALADAAWQEFAERESFALVGMRFVSKDEDLRDRRGYFVAARGSGDILTRGLDRLGLEGVPLCLYGFSGGAHFAMSYAGWQPRRVAGLFAHSFTWWTSPPPSLDCPAVISCGQTDGTRYGSSLGYFQDGRRQGKPWAWVSIEGLGHFPSAKLDSFVRAYISGIMRIRNLEEGRDPLFVDNLTERSSAMPKARDVGFSVLPDEVLAAEWRGVHHP